MQNSQANEKETLERFYVGSFDTPKKLNRSEKKVSSSDIADIENGICTIEMIEKMAKKLPIFIYRSCITIHGTFGDISRTSIGGYQNIRQNANGSLEILYSAIDRSKVDAINGYLRALGKGRIQTDSKGHTYMKKFATIENLREYCAAMKEMKGLVCSVFAFRYYGEYYVELSILSIKQTTIDLFLQVVTGYTSLELTEQYNAYNAAEAEKKAIWDKQMEQAQIQRKEAEERKQANLAPFIAKINHLPNCTAIEANVMYIQAGYFKEQGYCFKFVQFLKAPFGKVKVTFGYSTDLRLPTEMVEGKIYTKSDAIIYYSKMKVFK